MWQDSSSSKFYTVYLRDALDNTDRGRLFVLEVDRLAHYIKSNEHRVLQTLSRPILYRNINSLLKRGGNELNVVATIFYFQFITVISSSHLHAQNLTIDYFPRILNILTFDSNYLWSQNENQNLVIVTIDLGFFRYTILYLWSSLRRVDLYYLC